MKRALDAFLARLRERFGAELVMARLFGSRARGEADAASDVDVAVVLETVDFARKREVIDLSTDAGLEHDVLLSPTVFDRATYERWRTQGRPLVEDIEREGIAL